MFEETKRTESRVKRPCTRYERFVRLRRHSMASERRCLVMAETSKGKKFIRVQAYARADGTNVHTHDRSTPKTSHGAKRPSRSGHR